MNTKSIMFGAVCIAGSALFAVPTVENVRMEQPGGAGKVTITYDLKGEAAIVTFDVVTNGVSIGGDALTAVAGNINCKVAPADNITFSWKPTRSWPNHRITDGAQAVVTAWATNCPPTYMVIDLGNGIKRFYADRDQIPGGITAQVYKTDKLLMRKIPASHTEWTMGSTTQTDPNRQSDREQSHYVTLTKDFYMAIYPITARQYTYVKHSDDRWTQGSTADDAPASHLTYNLARGSNSDWPAGQGVESKSSLGQLANISGLTTFDLPTESQWEFACRAGTTGPYSAGTVAGDIGWYKDNCDGTPQPVGQKLANAFDLYDMHGNVHELCLDYFQKGSYTVGESVIDPPGVAREQSFNNWGWRLLRGGSCKSDASRISSSSRNASAVGSQSQSEPQGYRPVCDAVIP